MRHDEGQTVLARGSQKKKKDQGLFFFEMGSGHGLSTYVSGRLSIYGNDTSISV